MLYKKGIGAPYAANFAKDLTAPQRKHQKLALK